VNKRQRSLIFLVLGVALWIAGGVIIFFSDVLAVQIAGVALFAIGPVLVFFAGRLLRPER
jgi:hypothetical protein